jgi:hypothetical protein
VETVDRTIFADDVQLLTGAGIGISAQTVIEVIREIAIAGINRTRDAENNILG